MVRTAATGDYAELLAALLPCRGAPARSAGSGPAAGTPRRPDAAGIDLYARDDVAELAGWCRQARATRAGPPPVAEDRLPEAFLARSS